jgi:hypothetical protein
MTNINIPFLVKVSTDLLISLEVNKDGAAKVQENAQTVVSIGNAVVQSNGDPATIMTAIDTALAASTADPAKAAAIQTIIAWVGTKAAALQALASGSLTAAEVTTILVSAASEAVSVAQKYLPAAK